MLSFPYRVVFQVLKRGFLCPREAFVNKASMRPVFVILLVLWETLAPSFTRTG